MSAHPEPAIDEVESILREATQRALGQMEGTGELAARKAHLKEWEDTITRAVRPAYQRLEREARSGPTTPAKEAFSKRVGALTRSMVVDRSTLEGLAEGGPPKTHSAGKAFHPVSDCPTPLKAAVWEIVNLALELYAEECARELPGIRLSDLDPRVKCESDRGDAVYVTFYPNGHLKEAVLTAAGEKLEWMTVADGKAHARYQDSVNLAEFHPNGTIDEYGGRYEREVKARITFESWVKNKIMEMLASVERARTRPQDSPTS